MESALPLRKLFGKWRWKTPLRPECLKSWASTTAAAAANPSKKRAARRISRWTRCWTRSKWPSSLHAPSKRTVTGQRRCWLTWLRTSSVLITSTRARKWLASIRCSTRSAPCTAKTIRNCCRFEAVFRAGAGIDDAHDEGREDPVPLHSKDGRVGHPERTGVAAAIRQRAEPGDDDDA